MKYQLRNLLQSVHQDDLLDSLLTESSLNTESKWSNHIGSNNNKNINGYENENSTKSNGSLKTLISELLLSMFSNLEKKFISKPTDLVLLQELIDSAFNFATFNSPTSVEECTHLIQFLINIEPYIETLLAKAPQKSMGTVLYYKFKLFEFISNLFGSLSGPEAVRNRSKYLLKLLETWDAMESQNFFGSGNNVADPYKEIVELLIKLAESSCLHQTHGISLPNNDINNNYNINNNQLNSPKYYLEKALFYLNSVWIDRFVESMKRCDKRRLKELSGTSILHALKKLI